MIAILTCFFEFWETQHKDGCDLNLKRIRITGEFWFCTQKHHTSAQVVKTNTVTLDFYTTNPMS